VLEVAGAHELLAQAYREAGDLTATEAHLRTCLKFAPGFSGTSGTPDLTLAEVLIDQLDDARAHEAERLLDDPGLASRLIWNSQVFRFCRAKSLLAARLGDLPTARHYAREGLRIAGVSEPQLPRHPTVGLVQADRRALIELRRLAQ
jgi:hypothetical protein